MTKELLQQALDALTRLSFLGNGDFPGNSEGNRIAQKAVADIKQALSRQEQPASVDAYVGAREDAAIWKKRALEAEELNRKFIAELNGPTYLGEPAQQEQPSKTERQIRRMFCVTYASDSSPYMDDGEAQDNSRHPCIDFLRDSPEQIQSKMVERAIAKHKAQQEQLALTPINVDVTFSRGDIEELPEDQCPEWCAGSSDRDVKVHVHLGDAQPALSDERLAEIAKPFISSMGDHWCHEDGIRDNGTIEEFARAVIEAHCRGGANHGC